VRGTRQRSRRVKRWSSEAPSAYGSVVASTSPASCSIGMMTVARVYLDAEEGQIAGDLDAVVAAFPAVRIGSYPRFTERDFKVLITLEAFVATDVANALAMMIDRIGLRVVRHEPPTLAGTSA
jgi:hypothetical protein